MIGDGENDVLCGKNAGCMSKLIDDSNSLKTIIDEIIK